MSIQCIEVRFPSIVKILVANLSGVFPDINANLTLIMNFSYLAMRTQLTQS